MYTDCTIFYYSAINLQKKKKKENINERFKNCKLANPTCDTYLFV